MPAKPSASFDKGETAPLHILHSEKFLGTILHMNILNVCLNLANPNQHYTLKDHKCPLMAVLISGKFEAFSFGYEYIYDTNASNDSLSKYMSKFCLRKSKKSHNLSLEVTIFPITIFSVWNVCPIEQYEGRSDNNKPIRLVKT